MPLILIAIGIILIIYNYHFIKKERKLSNKENISNDDLSFRNVLQDNKDDLNDYKIEIGMLRKDIAESLTELQEEIIDIKNNLNMVKNEANLFEDKENEENYDGLNGYNIDNKSHNSEENKKEDEQISENKFLINSHTNDAGVISEINFSKKVHNAESNKTESIKNLLEKELTDEEICHELSVSKGEVLLVKSLFKK